MLGNWVEYAVGNGKRSIPMQVTGIFSDTVYLNFEGNEGDVFEEEEENLLGIEITEEILEKFCVKKQPIRFRPTFTVFEIEEFVEILKYDGLWSFSYAGEVHARIKYLHQLQNAYFMLTGKQLEVKL